MSEITNILEGLRKTETQKDPVNWVDRVMRTMMSKKKEQAMVHPCIINGQHTLVYEHGLEEKDPASFRQIIEFANAKGYQLKEDQRSDFLEGIKRVKNRRRANVVSVMVLTAGLMSQTAQAKSNGNHNNDLHISTDYEHTQTQADFELDLDSYNTEAELAAGLLGWINSHSSFTYDIDNIPNIKKVSSKEIAEVAFGGALPKAVNPDTLQIFGLYNFNDGAVYLLDSIDLDTDAGKGILLHELVHYLQYQTGIDKDAKCKNELESLAYVLEAKFLDSHDHDHNISASHINKVSQCRSA
ncbi:MAG: hypothetical protein DHS20C09_06010 [marine bacterium B5-7]|nr:MAG: hypothetical protein DHS20C09_06010 [marine bacterium B5-7]